MIEEYEEPNPPVAGLVTIAVVILAWLKFFNMSSNGDHAAFENPLYGLGIIFLAIIGLLIAIYRKEKVRYGVIAVGLSIVIPPVLFITVLVDGLRNYH